MKRLKILLILLITITAFPIFSNGKRKCTHRLATYNIRYTPNPKSAKDTGAREWKNRATLCFDIIKRYDFDVIGFQELSGDGSSYRNPGTGRSQLQDIKHTLKDYKILAWDRDGNKRLEYVGLAFKRKRYDLLDSGSFFISSTPEKYSHGWDTKVVKYPRNVGWAKLKDKKTGDIFIYASTHTNNGWSLDGPYGSQIIVKKINEIAGELPVMIVGDFNTKRLPSDQMGMKAYLAAFHDAAISVPAEKNVCLPKSKPNINWTFNWFHPAEEKTVNSQELDYQFYRGMNIMERHIVTDDYEFDGARYPSSDHFPVFVVAEISPVSPKAIFVDSEANTGGDGSITHPFKSISEGLEVSEINDTIYVAEGKYCESLHPNFSVTLLGGFDHDFTQQVSRSTISGVGLNEPPIYASDGINLTLKNFNISDYTSPQQQLDGAILFRGSDLIMENVVLENNSALGYGGALAIYDISKPEQCECNNIKISNCVFRNNKAKCGGAIAAGFYDKMNITGCSFENNSADESASALYITFGKPENKRIWFTNAKGVLTDCSFISSPAANICQQFINEEMPKTSLVFERVSFTIK